MRKTYFLIILTVLLFSLNVNSVGFSKKAEANILSYTCNFVTQEEFATWNVMNTNKLPSPVGVVATIAGKQIDVKWTDPSTVREFRYDSDKCTGGVGSKTGTPKTILGTVYNVPAELYTINWFTMKGVENYNSINIFVFDLDGRGKPTSRILYSAMGVPNKDASWNSYAFEIPVKAPNGFLIGVSIDGNGNVGVGHDDGKDKEYPFVPGVNYIAPNYESGFTLLQSQGFEKNLMLRATGRELQAGDKSEIITFGRRLPVESGSVDSPIEEISLLKGFNTFTPSAAKVTDVIIGYKVWRLNAGEELLESKWTLLTTNSITATTYADVGWGGLEQGCYKYAVKAIYASGLSSATFSAMLAKNMLTDVTVSVKANVPSLSAEGAMVKLTHMDGDAKHVYEALIEGNGKVMFSDIWKGKYSVSVSMHGFKTIVIDHIDFSKNNSYAIGEYELNEIVENPYNLKVTGTSTPNQRMLKWNELEGVSDDFEGHEDFAINSPGAAGWSYIDGDDAPTYGINNVKFKNMSEKMAYIVFNPNQTAPPMSQILAALPHSGLKYLASFATSPTQTVPNPPANDDYLVSPELHLTQESELRFWAKSYMPEYVEKFKVGYSTRGKAKADFSNWITSSPVNTPDQWTEFRYTIPANAKYVTIQYVSKDCFIFMLDDVYIGQKESGAIVQKYEIYLDGIKVGESNEKEYTFNNLALGKHTAGVKSVFLSKTTEMTTIGFDANDKSYKIKGLVKDNSGAAVIDAEVTITGSNTYKTKTSNSGEFEFPAVLVGTNYSIAFKKSTLAEYTKNFSVIDTDIIMNDIVMNDIPMKPGSVTVKGNDAQVTVSWLNPTEMITFRRDDGIATGGLGSNKGTDKTVVGAVYHTPAMLYTMSWMTAKKGDYTVNLFVFALKENGEPTSTVLFSAKDVLNHGGEINTYTFEEPINCPNGFLIGLSGTTVGNVAVACDGGTSAQWPFVPKVNYMAMDYTAAAGGFLSLDQSFPRNLIVRAEGIILYNNRAPVANAGRSLVGYKVWRLKSGKENKPEEWVAITQNAITATTCSDTGWANLTPGSYKYAVKAIYPANIVSETAFSNVIVKEAVTIVKIGVKTNATPNTAIGAKVKLQNKAGNQIYDAVVGQDGVATFSRVQKGVYDVTIKLDGFAMLNIIDMDFSTSNSYEVGPFTLKEMLPSPTDLVVVKEDTDFERLFTWKWINTEAKITLADFYSRGFATYEIFVDDVIVGQTAELFYRFTNLEHGTRKAGVRVRTTEGVSEIATVSFEVEEIRVGIDDVEDGQTLKLYPNPVTNGSLTIVSEDAYQVEIYNSAGKLVKSVSGMTVIDVSELSGGVYFLKALSDNLAQVCKFIIKK